MRSTRSIVSGVSTLGRPGRGSSSSPSIPLASYRWIHLYTVLRDTFCTCAILVGLYPSCSANKIRARMARSFVARVVFSQLSKIVLAFSVRTSIRGDVIFFIR